MDHSEYGSSKLEYNWTGTGYTRCLWGPCGPAVRRPETSSGLGSPARSELIYEETSSNNSIKFVPIFHMCAESIFFPQPILYKEKFTFQERCVLVHVIFVFKSILYVNKCLI